MLLINIRGLPTIILIIKIFNSKHLYTIYNKSLDILCRKIQELCGLCHIIASEENHTPTECIHFLCCFCDALTIYNLYKTHSTFNLFTLSLCVLCKIETFKAIQSKSTKYKFRLKTISI